MAKIERLAIQNFRGASTPLKLEFETDKQVVLIFGENGTGKTTIADALDAIGNCAKGSIGDKSSTNAKQHLPTIGRRATDVNIEIVYGGKTWTASLGRDGITTAPNVRPKIRVLRRNHIQKLIDAPPADRYEELRHFINVDKVERSENALLDAVKGVKAEFDSAVHQRADAELQLQNVWMAEGKPGGLSARAWAKLVADQDTIKLEQEVAVLRTTQKAVSDAENALTEFQNAVTTLNLRREEAQDVEQEIAKLTGIDGAQATDLAGILQNVEHYLQIGNHPEECPVCKQGIPLEKLKSDIASRLEQLKQYSALNTRRNTALRQVTVAEDAVAPKQAALCKAASSLLTVIDQGKITIISDNGIEVAAYVELCKLPLTPTDAACAEAERLITACAKHKQDLITAETASVKRSGQINSVREFHNRVESGIATSEQLEKLKSALEEAYNLARLTRIEFTQKILDEVAGECNRLYAILHPNEPLAISKLALDQAKRASLNQSATFAGHNDVPPQAYFSESHLDTLGFCFWLATAKRESRDEDTVIVLDDVFTSVDAQHINRLTQLITDESIHFSHVLITTHQRLWRDIYRNQRGAGKLVQMIELQRWSLSKGISNFKTPLAVEELRASISAAPFDRQITASKAGVLLEAILDHLALQYRCRVARTHDGNYTLGELLDGTESLFKKLETHRPKLDAAGNALNPPEYLKSAVTATFSQIRGLAFLRNQVGAHFNMAGLEIPDADVEQFAKLTVQLASELSCTTCGQIPGKKTAMHYQCSCVAPKEARILPLQL